MNDKEIGNLIKELRSQKNYDEAYIGYFEYGGGPDESCIKANRQGLELHAAELLEAALETEKEFNEEKIKTFRLDERISDKNSDFLFNYVELKKEARMDIKPNSEYKETWKDKLLKYIFWGVFIGIGLLIIIGLVTVISWI